MFLYIIEFLLFVFFFILIVKSTITLIGYYTFMWHIEQKGFFIKDWLAMTRDILF